MFALDSSASLDQFTLRLNICASQSSKVCIAQKMLAKLCVVPMGSVA